MRELRGKVVRGSRLTNPELALRYDVPRREIELSLRNRAEAASTFTVTANAYVTEEPWRVEVPSQGRVMRRWHTDASQGWYDVTVTGDGGFEHRFAGRLETGLPSTSDPEMGISRAHAHGAGRIDQENLAPSTNITQP